MYTPPRRSLGSGQGLSPNSCGLLPISGSHLRNKHGIEWIVDGHIKTSSLGTLPGEESELTAYPVIFPQNLSDRFDQFLNEVARCTPKVILPLDTMPTVFPTRAHPGGHSIDAWSHPEHIHIFIDAEDVSEVVLAHELAHAWIDLVRGIEDNRVWREREDTARYAQVQFMQSFVLDFAVDQILDEKGFDRSQIVEDWEVASAQLRIAAERGYQPDNRREALFMASHLASTLVEESRNRLPVRLADLFPVVSQNLPEIFSLAKGMVQSVLDHFPTDRTTARIAIDQILRGSFAFTDPGLDFESHLIHLEPEINWEMDKNPGWLTGQSVRAKCEIGLAMATVGATSADTPVLNREKTGQILVSFNRPDGSSSEGIPLEHAAMPPDPRIAHINEMMEESRRAKARMVKMNVMTPNRPPASPGPHLPNVPGFRPRTYSPGLARWLTRVRMEEMLAGENAYGYAENNPVTWTDPFGMKPEKPSLGSQIKACKTKQPNKACFDCVYVLLHTKYQYGPQRACNDANRICGSHVVCGPCGPGLPGFPKAPGCTDGLDRVKEFLDFLHGKAGQEACGGHQGFDKLAHCYANCMAVLCAGGWGVLYCRYQERDETDPEDVLANQLGRGIGFQSNVWNGQDCFNECANAVYGLESW